MIDSKRLKDDETPFTTDEAAAGQERVQKLIAQAGIASRRDAEDMIRDGLVTINGKKAALGDKATLGIDAIKVKGKLIHYAQNKVYYMIYKPKNVIAMIAEDEEGRETLKDFTHKLIKERVFTVGRMDFKGEGAIILTNDGEMAQKILKSNDIIRRYHVKVDRHPTQEELARLARGGRIEGRSMQPHHIRVAEGYARNALIEISFEGMGAIDVKTYFENKGFFPEKVARVGIGHLNAEKLPPGSFRKLNASSVEALVLQPELAKRQIERLVEKRAAGVKMVDDDIMAQDEERRSRRKTSAEIVTAPKIDPTYDEDGVEIKPKMPKVRISAFMHSRGAKSNTDRVKRLKAASTHSGPNSRSKTMRTGGGKSRPARGDDMARTNDRFTGGRTSERPAPRSFGDRPTRGGGEERPSRSFGGDRATRGGDRPTRSFGDKPSRGGSERGARSSFGDKPSRGGSDRPTRSFGDKPSRGGERSFGASSRGGDRPGRSSFGDKPARGGSDRPTRSFGDKPSRGGERSFGASSRGGDRPGRSSFGDKPARGGERSFGASSRGGDRPGRSSFGDKPARGGERSFGDKPARGGERSFGDKPARGGERPARASASKFGEPGRRASTTPAARGRPSAGGQKLRFKRD